MDLETRHVVGLEIRKAGGQPPKLVGYAAVFDSPSRLLPPGFVEIIRRGAFSRTLRERGDEIFAFVDHNPGKIIGRRGKNLTLEEDARGLRIEVTPIASQDGADVLANVEAGILDSMSFAFTVAGEHGQRWDANAKPTRRELLDVELFEVSVVAMPAYLDTSVAVRSMDLHRIASARNSVAQLQERAEARAAGWRRGPVGTWSQ